MNLLILTLQIKMPALQKKHIPISYNQYLLTQLRIRFKSAEQSSVN